MDSEEVEKDKNFEAYMNNSRVHERSFNEADAITVAAGELVSILENVACIVTYSVTGYTTFLTARERRKIPILAVTKSDSVAQRLSLCWGVHSFVNTEVFSRFDKVENTAISIATKNNFAKNGEHVVIIAGYPFGKVGSTNLLHTVKVNSDIG